MHQLLPQPFHWLWLSVLFSLIILPSILHAQTYLYPVKVDHKWGYMNRNGALIVEAQYDVIGEERLPYFQWPETKEKEQSPFRLVELAGKLGLIDHKMQPVLAPNYQRIRPLSDQYFAVAADSSFMLINREGSPLLAKTYKEILYLGTTSDSSHTYFLARNQTRWGVINADGHEILPANYQDVQLIPEGVGTFMVKSDSLDFWGLVNPENREILPESFLDIKACSQNFFAAQHTDTNWSAWDSLGQQIFDAKWLYFRRLNPHFISMRDTFRRAYLYKIAEQDTLPFQGRNIRYGPLDHNYILSYNRNDAVILDSTANSMLDTTYRQIKPTRQPTLFKVFTKAWGLYDIEKKEEVLACLYLDIGPFKDGYAEVSSLLGSGIINANMEEIIPLRFERIQREGNVFKGFRQQETNLFEVNDSGQVVDVAVYGNVKNLRVQRFDSGPIEEAFVVKRSNQTRDDEYYMNENPSAEVGPFFSSWWYFNQEQNQWSLAMKDTLRSYLYRKDFRASFLIDAPQLVLVAPRAYAIGGPLAKLMKAEQRGLSPLLLYSEQRENIIKSPVLLGLRRHDFERQLPLAAMIDGQGQFGLIDTLGQEKKDTLDQALRFSYIGEFVDGYARVCQGGQLKRRTNDDDGKVTLEPINVLVKKFCITPVLGSKLDYTRFIIAKKEDQTPKWGVIDTSGNIIIKPQYDYLTAPTEGQMAAKMGRNWGVIDLKNDTIVDFNYASVTNYYGAWRILDRAKGVVYFNQRGWQVIDREYSQRGVLINDRCRVQKDSLWGFVNGNGALIIDCQYDAGNDFSEGVSLVKLDGQWQIIDSLGKSMVDLSALQADTLGNFVEGLCWFKRGKKYGYINLKGAIVIPDLYTRAFDFAGGVGRVVTQGSTILIDHTGKAVVEAGKYQRIGTFNRDNLAIATASVKVEKHALLHANGRQLTPMEYQQIGTFSEGFAPVSDGQYYGFINRAGELVVPMRYERVRPFSHGITAVMQPRRQKWIFIDTTGRQIIDRTFDIVSNAYDGKYVDVREFGKDLKSRQLINAKGEVAAIDLSNVKFYNDHRLGLSKASDFGGLQYYYGNLKKELLFDGDYEDIAPFENGVAVVKKRGRKGVIDERGMMIVRPKYFYLEPQDDQLILAGPPAFGVADREGKILIDADYDSIELMSGNLYRVEQGEKVGYIDLRGRWVWPLQN